jgi:hypothetical protein
VFTFSVPNPAEMDLSGGKEKIVIKPQRVWALRKQFSGVRVRISALIPVSLPELLSP